MLRYRIRIGSVYVADPDIVGLGQHWTGTPADALPVTARTALEILNATMLLPEFEGRPYAVEPLETNPAL